MCVCCAVHAMCSAMGAVCMCILSVYLCVHLYIWMYLCMCGSMGICVSPLSTRMQYNHAVIGFAQYGLRLQHWPNPLHRHVYMVLALCCVGELYWNQMWYVVYTWLFFCDCVTLYLL